MPLKAAWGGNPATHLGFDTTEYLSGQLLVKLKHSSPFFLLNRYFGAIWGGGGGGGGSVTIPNNATILTQQPQREKRGALMHCFQA